MARNVILRRRKLGRTSCREIASLASSDIKVVRNWRDAWPTGTDIVFRWGCTSSLPYAMTTVNTAESIHWCSDKKNGRLEMQQAGVPVPESWFASAFYADYVQGLQEYVDINDTWVLRPAVHAQGRNLIFGNAAMIAEYISNHQHYREGYVSRLINKVAEFRVFVCQNRAVWVAKKTPADPTAVAWNVAQGGRFDNVRWADWNTKVLQAALAAAKVSGTDFCGVDVMVDAEGLPYVLEVNSAPSQTSPYRQSCVAKAFDYIIQNNSKAHFEDVEWNERRTWKSYIHPAVRGDSDADN